MESTKKIRSGQVESSGGGSQDLDSVLNEGATSDIPIVIEVGTESAELNNLGVDISSSTRHTALVDASLLSENVGGTKSNELDLERIADGVCSFKFPEPVTGDYVLPLTVNGQSPDAEGDITIVAGGTVSPGLANTLAYYPANGSVVDDLPAITNDRVLISDTNGLPVASPIVSSNQLHHSIPNKIHVATISTGGSYGTEKRNTFASSSISFGFVTGIFEILSSSSEFTDSTVVTLNMQMSSSRWVFNEILRSTSLIQIAVTDPAIITDDPATECTGGSIKIENYD